MACLEIDEESSKTKDSLLIFENDNFQYPSTMYYEPAEMNCLFSQQPYEVEVGKGCSLPQMPTIDGDVDQLLPYQYLEGKFNLKNEEEVFVPYYDFQMGAIRTGQRSFVFDFSIMNVNKIETPFESLSKIKDSLFTDLQIQSLM